MTDIKYIGARGTPQHVCTELFTNKKDIEAIMVVYKTGTGQFVTGWSLLADEQMVYMQKLLEHTVNTNIFDSLEGEVKDF